jgi:hypothetical protein
MCTDQTVRFGLRVELKILPQVQQTPSLDLLPQTPYGLNHVRSGLWSVRDTLGRDLQFT